jgi:hypothetical protein
VGLALGIPPGDLEIDDHRVSADALLAKIV